MFFFLVGSLALSCLPRRRGTYHELVCHGASGGDGALGDTAGPVHLGCADLVDAMEVQAGSLVSELVVDRDSDGIADSCLDRRARPRVVDTNDGPGKLAIGVGSHPGDVPVIGWSPRLGEGRQGQESER